MRIFAHVVGILWGAAMVNFIYQYIRFIHAGDELRKVLKEEKSKL